jgi:hypothetical protein
MKMTPLVFEELTARGVATEARISLASKPGRVRAQENARKAFETQMASHANKSMEKSSVMPAPAPWRGKSRPWKEMP